MTISENLLPDFEEEIARTRTTLERVPVDKFDWKPHPKSGSMLWLARHVADLPSLGALIVTQDELDAAPGRRPVEPRPRHGRHRRRARQHRPPMRALCRASDRICGSPVALSSGTVLFPVRRGLCFGASS